MNRSMMPKQVMAYNQGGIASFIPQQTQIMGQPHRLAYVNPQEEQMMLNQGGAGTPGPGGIPAYWTLTEPSTWGDGAGYEGMGNFNASDNDNTSYTDTSSIAGISEASGVNYTGNDDNDQNVGFIDSIAMGTGFKDKTPAYYNTTAQTIAASQGPQAAQNYLNNLFEDGTISSSSHGVFSNAASQVPINEMLQNDNNNDNNNNNTVVVDDGTVDDGTVTEDGEPQYTYMPPFYGGYQASTAADTLVPSGGAGIASFVPPRPPIQPVQQTLNTIQPTPLPQAGGLLPVETTDYTNPMTGVIGEAPVFSGGFNSMEELTAYQNQNPTANLMGEYQRLKALQGGNTTAAGVGSVFGNEPAQPYMYQGIMG